jgi:hypothetical protein
MRNKRRAAVQVAFAVTLILVGWAVGKGQAIAPDFELLVDAPGGETTIQCVKGCKLAWVERGVNPNATPQPTFTYRCTGSTRCSSARVGGWLNP